MSNITNSISLTPVIPYLSNENFSCKMIDENDLKSWDKAKPSVFIISLNVQGLLAKREKLNLFINSISNKYRLPDIICVQETWLNRDSEPFCLSNYHPLIHSHRSNAKGGGVGFFVHENISYDINYDLSLFVDRIYESIAINIHIDNKRYSLVNLYRPPTTPELTDTESFNIFLSNLNKVIDKCPHNSYFFMDSNVNLLHKNLLADKFIDLWSMYGFSNSITTKTRITLNNSSLIDQIFINNLSASGSSGTISSDVSDHLPIFMNINSDRKPLKSSTVYKRVLSPNNISFFKEKLSTISWVSVLEENNITVAYSKFVEIWNLLFDQAFPLKCFYINRQKFPIKEYFSLGLLVSRATKIELYKKFLLDRSAFNETKYKTYRNCFNRCIRLAKKIYYEDKIDKCNDPKKAWSAIYDALGKQKVNKSCINSINIGDEICNNSQQIADHFNDFFSSIADSTINKIPPTKMKPNDFPFKNVSSSFEFRSVDTSFISDIIKKLEPKVSTDINGFSSKLLKESSDYILGPLTHLVNLSLSQGHFPCELKISRTCPIFKNGCQKEASNYRPIACLPVLSKVFEKVVFNQLYDYLTFNKILSPNQFGFQPGKSTLDPLIQILNYIAESFNQNKFVVAVFLDLSKAFDLVNHKILLDKLKKIGLDEISLKWFNSYLSNRKMFTSVNNVLSSNYKLLSRSVPQGSILGPLLFLIFINDLPLSINLDSFLFADDTTALTSGHDIQITGNFVNAELQKLGLWLRSNELCINTNKTKVMVFSNKKNVADFPFIFNSNDLNSPEDANLIKPLERITNLSSVPAIKMLGVYLDEFLSFDYHCKKVCNKINSAMFFISSARNVLSSKALMKLYYALVHPHILYCLPAFSFTSAKNRKLIFNKQKQCIRIITKSKYNSHTEPLFFATQILPLDDLIVQQKLVFMHSLMYGHSAVIYPHFISNLNANEHRYVLRNDDDYFVPRTNLTFVQKMPLIDFPLTWNRIDQSLKEISSKLLFKKTIKLELLDKYRDFRCTRTICISCMDIESVI